MLVDTITFIPTFAVPKGEPLIADNGTRWYVHPSDWLLQIGKGQLPFETRHCLGIRELERDRRRRP